MLIGMNCDKLIELVKQRRALYDPTCTEYSNKKVKIQQWQTVYAQLIDKWHTLDGKEKVKLEKGIQKRWNSLRDCFRRELALQRKTPPGCVKRRRKYMYFDQLRFLLPCSKTASQPPLKKEKEDTNDPSFPQTSTLEDPIELTTTRTEQPSNIPAPKKKKRTSEEEVPNVIADNHQLISQSGGNALDDDTSFLLSLLPSFKKYDYEKKLMLRMEVLNTVLKFERFCNNKMKSGNGMHVPNISGDVINSSLVSKSTSSRYGQPQSNADVLEMVSEVNPTVHKPVF